MDKNRPLFIMSVAANLVGMHPQTLRKYERAGLMPHIKIGHNRLYSQNNIDRLLEIKDLSQKGVNIAGMQIILREKEHGPS